MTAVIVFSAIQLAGSLVIFFWLRTRIQRLSGLESRLAGFRDEAEALAADFGEVSDRNIGLLEDRIAVMRDLLEQAQARTSSEIPKEVRRPDPVAQSAPIVLSLGNASGRSPHSDFSGNPSGKKARSPRTEALDLYRAGFSSDAIAARLGLSVAEVELIVGLEERRGS